MSHRHFVHSFPLGYRRSCFKNSEFGWPKTVKVWVDMLNKNQFTEEIICWVQGVVYLPERRLFTEPSPRERLPQCDWCKHIRRERTACASKNTDSTKSKGDLWRTLSLLMQVFCSWLPSNTCINHTWHGRGLWWIGPWARCGDENMLDKSARTILTAKMKGEKKEKTKSFLFQAADYILRKALFHMFNI